MRLRHTASVIRVATSGTHAKDHTQQSQVMYIEKTHRGGYGPTSANFAAVSRSQEADDKPGQSSDLTEDPDLNRQLTSKAIIRFD